MRVNFFPSWFSKKDKNKSSRLELIERNRAFAKDYFDNCYEGSSYQSLNLPKIEMEEIFVDTTGNTYYRYKDPLSFPIVRNLPLERAQMSLKFGVTEKYLIEKAEENIKSLASGDLDIIQRNELDLKERLKSIPEENALLNCACVLIVRHDEDPYTYNSEMVREKMKISASDPKLRAFFLTLSWEWVKKFRENSEELKNIVNGDILTYLLEEEERKGSGLTHSAATNPHSKKTAIS